MEINSKVQQQLTDIDTKNPNLYLQSLIKCLYIIIYVTSNIVKHIKKCDVYHMKIHQVPKPNKFKQQINFVFVVIHKIQIFQPNF